MRKIEIDKQVYDEIARRVAGQSDLVGVYLKGFVDGMIQGFDPREFALNVVVTPGTSRPESHDSNEEPEFSYRPLSVREKLDVVFLNTAPGTVMTIPEVARRYIKLDPTGTIAQGALYVVHRNLRSVAPAPGKTERIVAEEVDGRKVFRKL